jgi:hypothetical protein
VSYPNTTVLDSSMKIKKGNPVEFTRNNPRVYTIGGGDGEYGIAIEDERDDMSVTVELADGSTYLARHIHAYAWAGWLPDDLEPIYMKHNPDTDDYEDYR